MRRSLQIDLIPKCCSLLSLKKSSVQAVKYEDDWETALPYNEIPGPKPLPIPKYGNVWRAIPGIGDLNIENWSNLHRHLYQKYGPIVKLTGFGRPDVILLFDPADAEKMFRNETKWPIRPAFESCDYYRRITRKDVFQGSIGILSTQGQEWYDTRSAVNKPLLKISSILNYHKPLQDVARLFVERMRKLADEKSELPKDFFNEINKWALESISTVTLETSLGCLAANLEPDSEAQIMIDASQTMFEMSFRLDFLPSLWNYYPTSDWKKFTKAMDTIIDITSKYINRKTKEVQQRPKGSPAGQSVLEEFLSCENGKAVAVTMAMDMLSAGIDTTSSTTAIALYYLSKSPEVQEKAHEEVLKILPNKDDKLPVDFMDKVPYIKAIVKESQRMTPVGVGNARMAGKDMVIKGYQVPKMTQLGSAHQIMCEMEEHFPRAKEFIPERWLKTEKGTNLSAENAHPFVFMPFGFGPRMCAGRRLAELEMYILLSLIVRNFKLNYNYPDMKWGTHLHTYPKNPLRFQIIEW